MGEHVSLFGVGPGSLFAVSSTRFVKAVVLILLPFIIVEPSKTTGLIDWWVLFGCLNLFGCYLAHGCYMNDFHNPCCEQNIGSEERCGVRGHGALRRICLPSPSLCQGSAARFQALLQLSARPSLRPCRWQSDQSRGDHSTLSHPHLGSDAQDCLHVGRRALQVHGWYGDCWHLSCDSLG